MSNHYMSDRAKRRTRIYSPQTQHMDGPATTRPSIVNFSNPIIHQDRVQNPNHPIPPASSLHGFDCTDPDDANMPIPPSLMKSTNTNSRRSVDVLKAPWNISTSSTLALPAAGDQSELLPCSPTNHYGMPTLPPPTAANENESKIPPDWPGIENGLLKSVTLRDGRVAERDCASGQWKWRPESNMSGKTLDEESYAKLSALERSQHSSTRSQSPMERPCLPLKSSDTLFAQSSRPHEIAFIITVCLAQFLALAGLAQTVATLPIIGTNFGVSDPGTLSWYTAAFSLTVGTFILPAGRVGDMLGHKRVYIIGWLWYAVWSIITGFTFKSSSVVFTICRAFQGIGPAFLVPNAMALIGVTFPIGKKRNIIFALFGSMGPTGFVAGSIFSSLFAQVSWWPWAFWCMSILCILIAGFAYLIIPSATKTSPLAVTGKFDFYGAITGVTGLVLINFAFNQAPLSGWGNLYIPVLLVVGIATIALFVFIELAVAESPLIPLKDLGKEGLFALGCIACGWGSHGIWLYHFFLFTERLRGFSPLAASAQISPVAITGVVFALSTGLLVKKIKVAYIMFIAMLGFLVGLILLAAAPVHQTYWGLTFISVLLTPIGMNLSFPAGTVLLSNAMPREHQGVAASLISTMVNYSISTGLGIAGTIDRYSTAAASHSAPPGVSPPSAVLLQGYRGAWYFGMGLDCVGLALSGYFIWRSRDKA